MRFFIFTLQMFVAVSSFAQDTTLNKRWSPLKYNSAEIPITFGIGPMTGAGTYGPILGIGADLDIYHILVSATWRQNIPFLFIDDVEIKESFIVFGYMFRIKSFMISTGYGFGSMDRTCTDDRTYYSCLEEGEGRVGSKAFKFEIHYAFKPFASVEVGYYYTASKNTRLNTVMAGIKFGIFRRTD